MLTLCEMCLFGDNALSNMKPSHCSSLVGNNCSSFASPCLRIPTESRKSRTVACVALGRMVSHASAPILVAALQDRDEGVRNAAYAALRRVTGKDLPNDIDAWEAAVRQR